MITYPEITATYQATGGAMATPSIHTITQLLLDWSAGDQTAREQLFKVVEKELRRIARGRLRKEIPGHGLQTADLVQEAYLRLVGGKQVPWQNSAHFYAASSQIMRCILIDIYRRNRRRPEVPIDEASAVSQDRHVDLVALDDAL